MAEKVCTPVRREEPKRSCKRKVSCLMTILYKDPDSVLKPRGAVGGGGYSRGMVYTFYTRIFSHQLDSLCDVNTRLL